MASMPLGCSVEPDLPFWSMSSEGMQTCAFPAHNKLIRDKLVHTLEMC